MKKQMRSIVKSKIEMSEIKIRDIVESDIDNGFLESLDSLRNASDLNKDTARDILKKIIGNPDHIIHVAEVDGKVKIGRAHV